jgi:hypothetical protein
LIVPGVAATTGILKYRESKGDIRRELVTADTLKEAAKSLVGKPVTLEHPSAGEVNPDNYQRETVGEVAEATFDEDAGKLRVLIRVKDREAIDKVQAGTRELSPGYDVELKHEPGEHDEHGEYDVIQNQRIHNHLALTEEARGEDATITRLDSNGNATMKLRQDESDKERSDAPEEESDGTSSPESTSEGGQPADASEEGEESSDERSRDAVLRDIESKLDRLTSTMGDLLESMKPEGSDEDDEGGGSEGEEPSSDGEGGGSDTEKRMDWFRERRDALDAAERVGADVDEEADTLVEIKRKAVEARRGKRFDSKTKVETAYELEFDGDGDDTRQDSGPSFGPDAHRPTDGGGEEDDFDDRGETESRKTFHDNLTG